MRCQLSAVMGEDARTGLYERQCAPGEFSLGLEARQLGGPLDAGEPATGDGGPKGSGSSQVVEKFTDLGGVAQSGRCLEIASALKGRWVAIATGGDE